MRDLLHEEAQGVAGSQGSVAVHQATAAGELIDGFGCEKILRAGAYARERLIERGHPWPPVKRMMS